MKILVAVHNLTGGGAERVAALWATGLYERGYDVAMLVCCDKNTPRTYKVPLAVNIYNICGSPAVSWITNKLYRKVHIDFYYIYKIRKVFEDYRPDVVIGVLQPYAEWARKASKGMGIRIINTEHNSFERPASAPMSKKEWKQKYEWNKRYDQVTVLNYSDRSCTEGYLTNVSVLPNPLAFTPSSDFSKKEKVVLAAGRLDDWHCKGFDILAKVWGIVAPKFPNWRLDIAGKGTEHDKKRILAMMDEEGIAGRVNILGYQSDMLPVYERSSVFILTSRYEGFGMVLIEAMSQGCACIACDYRGRQREIITNDKEGIICPVEDVNTIASSLSSVLFDKKLREKLQYGAIKRSQYYNLNNIINYWDEILNKL